MINRLLEKSALDIEYTRYGNGVKIWAYIRPMMLLIRLRLMLSGGIASFQQHCRYSRSDCGLLQHRFQSLDLHGTV